LFASGVADTGGKFATGINNTSGTGGKFAAGVVDTSGKFDFRISPKIFVKISVLFLCLGKDEKNLK
jgi:hypothetical protein